jgi:hypothetical protein
LVLFYNLDRLIEPIKISNITTAFVIGVVIFTLVIPRLVRIPLWALITTCLSLLLLMKAWVGEFTGSFAVERVLIEGSSIVIAVLLASWVSLALSDFENAITQITTGRHGKGSEAILTGQGAIYREVRRARNHHRPLALLSVSVDEQSLNSSNLNRIIQEAQLSVIKQYKLASLSKTLCEELEDCSIIVQSDNRYLVVLPETEPEELPVVIGRIRHKVSEMVGVEVKIGAASLPDDSLTFEGLLDKATEEMEMSQKSEPLFVV